MSNLLIVMRLIEMHRRHPGQSNAHTCAKCGERVGIYPSGQKALIEDPELEIICNVCADVPGAMPTKQKAAAASMEEFVAELKDSSDVSDA